MVHQLLSHLRDRGFALAPDALGIDGDGREVLTFLPGETMTEHPWPNWLGSDTILCEAVQALVAYHKAVADFRPAIVESRLGTSRLRHDEIVCHNDFAPYNCVFSKRHLTGVIDWDVVCAGRPAWDLAFFAWHWVPLHAPTPEIAWRSVGVCQRRLRLIVDLYGLADRTRFLEEILLRIDASRVGIIERAATGNKVFARLLREGHPDEMWRAMEFIKAHERILETVLQG
jgi:aminoglycoside phosphotransferase (APT) family kinase protein